MLGERRDDTKNMYIRYFIVYEWMFKLRVILGVRVEKEEEFMSIILKFIFLKWKSFVIMILIFWIGKIERDMFFFLGEENNILDEKEFEIIYLNKDFLFSFVIFCIIF